MVPWKMESISNSTFHLGPVTFRDSMIMGEVVLIQIEKSHPSKNAPVVKGGSLSKVDLR